VAVPSVGAALGEGEAVSSKRTVRDRYEFEHWRPISAGGTSRGSTTTIDIKIKSTQDVSIQDIGIALDEAVARIKRNIGVQS
jgi:hypothetical protein